MWLIGMKTFFPPRTVCNRNGLCVGDTCFDAAAFLFDAERPAIQLRFFSLLGNGFSLLLVEWGQVGGDYKGRVVWKVMAEKQHN